MWRLVIQSWDRQPQLPLPFLPCRVLCAGRLQIGKAYLGTYFVRNYRYNRWAAFMKRFLGCPCALYDAGGYQVYILLAV